MIRIAVIAGTQVDTRMGVEYIEKKNSESGAAKFEPMYLPVSENCDEQIRFQYADAETKRRRIDEIFDEAIAAGIQDFFIYCNSLSGAFDFDTYAPEKSEESGREIRIYTPLRIYRQLGKRFRRVGAVAAHNLSTHNIEAALLSANEDLYMIGSGNMAIVSSIEEGLVPADIVRECGLEYMVKYMERCGCEALILGCTHFPYIREELDKICRLEIIDPADEMYRAMCEANNI